MAPSTEVATDLDWRRPHPLTILVEIGTALRSVLFALFVVRANLIDAGSLIELTLVAGPLVAALGRWYTTRYALDTEALYYHHGLIWRRRQLLPRANIQNVSTKAGIVARLGSVVELQISDASSNGDITLRFVSKTDAEHLTTLLRSSAPNPALAPTPASPPSASPPPEPSPTGAPTGAPVDAPALISPTLRQLLLMEATSIPVMVAVGSAVMLAASGSMAIWLQPYELPVELFRGSDVVPWLALLAAVGAPLLLAVFHVATRLTLLGGYRLVAEPDRLRIQVGLLTEARITARRERLQQIKVERDLPHRWLGRERVRFETADIDLTSTPGTRYLSPAGQAGGWRALALEALGRVDLDEPNLAPVSPLTRRRMMFRFGLVSVLWLTLALIHWALPIPWIAGWLAAGWWYSRRRYRALGWAMSHDQYLVRSGVILGRLTLVDLDKVQSLRLSSSWFQGRLGLATFQVSTAGHAFAGLVSLPDLDRATAERLLDRLARRAASTPISHTL